jgi:DNA-binding MarR family transcriptional regulator
MISSLTEQATQRTAEVEQIALDLMPRISQLSRLVVKHARGSISRSEGGILGTLSRGARRVTELAELEGLAQPTTTVLIKRLEQNGWVARQRDADDGRVVLVSLTRDGAVALEQFRSQYRAVLRDRLAMLPGEHVAALANASEALDALVGAIQKGDHR